MKKKQILDSLKNHIAPMESTADGKLRGGFSCINGITPSDDDNVFCDLPETPDVPVSGQNIGCVKNGLCVNNITCFNNEDCYSNGPCHGNGVCTGNGHCITGYLSLDNILDSGVL